MSDLSQTDLIRLAIEAGKLTRLEQIFPTLVKNTFAKEMGWNPSALNERIANARLFDMKTIQKLTEVLQLTPEQCFLLAYNQYLHNKSKEQSTEKQETK
jgi:hypothetical protein